MMRASSSRMRIMMKPHTSKNCVKFRNQEFTTTCPAPEGVVVGVEETVVTTGTEHGEDVAIEVEATGAIGAGSTGATGGAGITVMSAVPIELKISVPLPSFARTEPSANESGAEPGSIAWNVTSTTSPSTPVKPGLRTTPAKLISPPATELVNVGACTHR